ncbi:UNVERIFIED_CONTAM: Filament-like plant protein 7 [Sesamum latifolium]|uniref:Filament-like plant protein 7 n=1 Tax=Sesamum latifolium TaxID=2727402 RepID=A0AAW2X8A3_9LAMI
MDQKAWLWKKRSAEKTLAADKANNSFISNEEEEEEAECRVEELLTEKGHLERDLRVLNEKLSSALSECNSKDNIAKKQVKIAQEAIAGWEKAKAEAISLKKDLDRVLQQKADSEERLSHLDAALKECMQQLRFVREEQEKRVQGAMLKATEEFERTRSGLDEKLAKASKRVAGLVAENGQLNKALSGKEKVIEELSKYKAQVETDLNALMSRVEYTEKENASLKYEVRVLEKELEIRNEEREFNRRTDEVAQKQHMESVKKIEKLQTECQRLRLLVQKRLPGPAALVKMKNEVEMLGRGQDRQVEMRRRRSNPSLICSMDFRVDLAADDAPSKRINFLNEQFA